MRNESALTVRFKTDIILILILIVIGLGILITRHPFHLTSEDSLAPAMMPPQLGHGETLLILPAETHVAQTFEELDFSFAWYNYLTQEIGPFSIALTDDLNDAAFESIRLIVIPRRTAALMNAAQIGMVETAVTRGASLLIEMPDPAWANLTAVKQKPQTGNAIRHFTDAPNSPLPADLKDALLNFPLDTQVLRLETLDNVTLGHSDLLLELDGAIAHYHLAHGAGHVFVLGFDLGRALTALTQGRPDDDFQIAVEEDKRPLPSSLILNEKLGTNTIPYADILKRHILQSIWRIAPQAVLWPFPNAEKTALIITHDIHQTGDMAQYIVSDEQTRGLTSTLFVSTENTTASWLSQTAAQGFDIGVLMVRPPVAQTWRHAGPSFFSPVWVERNMEAQKRLISGRSRRNITACRMYAANWDSDYTTTFRKLTAAKCQMDLSYMPDNGQYGYLFGSGFPFLPMDHGGLPFPVYELPTLWSDSNETPLSPDITAKLLKESAERYHQPVVFNFSADAMRDHPHYQSIEAWTKATDLASQLHIRRTTVQSFMEHFSARKKAKIESTFHENKRTLDVSLELPETHEAYTLAIPNRTMHGSVHAITVDQKPYDPKALSVSSGGIQLLLPIPSGVHQVFIQYD